MLHPRFPQLACLTALLLSSCSLELVGLGDATWASLDASPGDGAKDGVFPAEELGTDSAAAKDADPGDIVEDVVPSDITLQDLPGEVCSDHSQCDDEVECTQDRCQDGYCRHLADDMACGAIDGCFSSHCDPQAGCQPLILVDAPCQLEDKCVLSAYCSAAGECTAQQRVTCKSTPCMESSCDPATGSCVYQKQTGAECDDANPCTIGDTCLDGVCVGVIDEGACLCDSDEQCGVYAGGNLCVGKMACVDGHCTTVSQGVVCPQAPPNSCFQWSCDPPTGECVKTFLGVGTMCFDGNSCTKDDHCEAGACVGTAVFDSTPCNLDGDACTQDACGAGVCSAGPKKVCVAPDECSSAACEPASGKCVLQPLDGGWCDDGDECTQGESCLWGQCTGGTWVCVDCSLPQFNGSVCDDGVAGTVGDFCFAGECKGFASANLLLLKLSAGTALGTYLDWVHVVGVGTWNGQAASQAGIAEFSWLSGQPAWVGVGVDPLLDVDGPVAVGKPGLVYYRGMNWTANNLLKLALQTTCVGFGVSSKPVSVAHLSDGALSGLGLGTDIVAIGFETTADALEKGCAVAVCESKDLVGGWTCSALPVDWAAGSVGTDGMKVRVNAMDLELGGPCGGVGGACQQQLDLLMAYEVTQPGGSSWGVGEALRAPGGDTWQYAVLHSAPLGTGMDAPGPVFGLDLRSDGAFAAVGGKGLLFARGPGESAGELKSLPWDPTKGTPTLTGVVLQDTTTVVLANASSAADPNLNATLTAGLLAGPGGWVFDPQSSGVTFVPLSQSVVCGTCGEVDGTALGLRDGAARVDTGRLVLLLNKLVGTQSAGEVLFLAP